MRGFRRWILLLMVLAVVLLAALALTLPACGAEEGCRDGAYRCVVNEAQRCVNMEWEPVFECYNLDTCCMVQGYPTCAVNCI